MFDWVSRASQLAQALLAWYAPYPCDMAPIAVDNAALPNATNPGFIRRGPFNPGEIIAVSASQVRSDTGATGALAAIWVEVGDESVNADPTRVNSKAFPLGIATWPRGVVVIREGGGRFVAIRRQLTSGNVPVYMSIWPVGAIFNAGG